MRLFALIDIILQAILIIGGFVMGLVNFNGFNDGTEYVFLSYFVVGGWQIFSVIVHLAGEGTNISKPRKIYFYGLLFLVIAMFVVAVLGGVLLAMFVPLFVSPVLAIMYWFACYSEFITYQAKAKQTIAEELEVPGATGKTD